MIGSTFDKDDLAMGHRNLPYVLSMPESPSTTGLVANGHGFLDL